MKKINGEIVIAEEEIVQAMGENEIMHTGQTAFLTMTSDAYTLWRNRDGELYEEDDFADFLAAAEAFAELAGPYADREPIFVFEME